jgi:maleate isomerase
MHDDIEAAATHRAGLLIPSSNTTVEHEYNRFGPAALSWHVGRLTFTDISAQGIAAQDPDMRSEAAKLATARPQALLVAQSATGFVQGAGYERDLVRRLSAITGGPVLSAATVMVAAVRAFGATRIGLAMPFSSGIDTLVERYFTACGITPVRSGSLGITENFAVSTVTAARLIELAHAADAPEVEVVVIPGGNLRAMGAVAAIEAALGKPVVITNQAGIWAICGVLGLPCGPRLPGRLATADLDFALRRGLIG